MIRLCILVILHSVAVFGDSSIYDQDSNVTSSEERGRDSLYKQEASQSIPSQYLNNYNKDGEDVNIEPKTYGNRDMTGKTLSYNLENLENISFSDSKDLINQISKFSRYHVGLSFLGFTNDYSSEFKKMFFDSTNADSIDGSFVFSLDQKIVGNSLSLNYLTGLGVSFFKGSGYFSDDGTEANMTISLWFLPIDFGLATVYSIGSYARILLGGGLSGVAAIQSRSDLDEENDSKVLFQFGYGPFLAGKLNIGLNKFFPKFSLSMFRDYGVTNTFLNLEYRFYRYSNFKDDFVIKNNSIGMGISFNFM